MAGYGQMDNHAVHLANPGQNEPGGASRWRTIWYMKPPTLLVTILVACALSLPSPIAANAAPRSAQPAAAAPADNLCEIFPWLPGCT